MKNNRNYIFLVSQSLFAVIIAVCAFYGMMETSSGLVERAVQLANTPVVIEKPETPLASPEDDTEEQVKAGKAEEGLKDGVYYGTGTGYGGDIRVKLTVEDGRIAALDIVDASKETPSFFSRARSVADSIVKAGTADVDGVSGATLSSNGIKQAAADAIKQAGGKGSVKLKQAAKSKAPKGKTKKASYKKPQGGWKDGVYTGSARGYGGPVSVTVTIKNGKISGISASGKSETSSYWNRAQAVKSRIIKAQDPKVDAVSGATYSSNGIINAVIQALNKAVKTSGPKAQSITTSDDEYIITVGDTASLKAKAKTGLSYKSSDSKVASVDSSGKVTGISAGTAKITVTAAKTSKYKKASRKVSVIVSRKEQSITMSELAPGATAEFKEEDKGAELPLNASSESGQPLVYTSDNTQVAIVSDSGVVKVVGPGTARITITAPETEEYEGASTFINIKVKEKEKPDEPDEPATDITGVFSGSGKGYGGQVTCTVTIDHNVIKEIAVEGKNETGKYWTKAKKIVKKMVSQQTWDVDAVSGATLSSNGIRNAVKQALEQAGLI